MLTSRTTRWVAGTTLLCVLLLAAAWLLLVMPRRAEASELREANVAAQEQNDQLEIKIAQLRAQFADLPQKQAELADILAQLPPDAGMARLVRDLDAMAQATGVQLDGVTPGAPQVLGADGQGGAGQGGVAEGGVGEGGTGQGSAVAAPTAPSGGSAGTAAGSSGVIEIPVTVVVSGDYFQTVAFLKQMQTQMPRAFLVTTVQMTAGSGAGDDEASAGQVQVTVAGSVFALPSLGTQAVPDSSVSASATPTSPMGAGTATPSPSGTASGSPSSTGSPWPTASASGSASAAAGKDVAPSASSTTSSSLEAS